MTAMASLRSFLRDRGSAIADLLLAIAACWFASGIYFSHEAAMQHYGVVLPLSSDNVAPYLLFDDLFRRHLPLSGWMFPEAPSYVPDILLAWGAYVVAGSLVGAVELYALISAVAFVLIVRAVLLRAGYSIGAWRIWLALWIVSCAIGVASPPSWSSHLYGYIFMPYIHSGMLIGVIAGVALLINLDKTAGRWTIVALALLTALILISDRLFALQFALPAIAVGAWAMRKSSMRVRAVLTLAAILAATEAWRWLRGAPVATEANDRTPVTDSLQGFAANIGSLALHDPVNTLLIAAGFAAAFWTLRSRYQGDTGASRRWLAGFALISTILPIVVALALGRFHTVEELRYLQSLQLLGLPLAGLLADGIERIARTRAPALIAGALVIAIIMAPAWSGASRATLRDYLVDQETCLQSAIARGRLALGAATYWRANEMTARFPDGPVIVPLSVDVAPRMRNNVDLGWLSPIDANAPLPPLTFVDEYGYTPDTLDRSFGPASRRVACPRSAYRIYKPEDGALAHLYGYADWLPSQLLQRTGVAAVPAAAWAAEPKYAAGDAVRAAGMFAQPTVVLATAIDIPKGVVAVDLAYRFRVLAPGAMVQWHIAIVDEAGRPQTELGSGRLDASAGERRFALPLGVRGAAGDVLGISLAVAGGVDLEISRVRVAVR